MDVMMGLLGRAIKQDRPLPDASRVIVQSAPDIDV